MRFALLGFGAVTVFTLSLVGLLAATGNLNQDAINRLRGLETEAPHADEAHGAKPAGDDLDPIARQMQKRSEELNAREKELKDYEAQLNQRSAELDALYQQVEAKQAELESAVNAAEEKRQQEIETVANTVSNMKPKAAAERMANMPVPDMVEVLRKVKDKDRGRIVQEMDTETATEVLKRMQEVPGLMSASGE